MHRVLKSGAMEKLMKDRKEEEAAFHDRVRDDRVEQRWSPEAETATQDNPLWSNFKYYAIERKSLDFYRNWLTTNVKNKKVLDFGCGNGEESIFVAKAGGFPTGIDISETAVSNSRKQALASGVDEQTTFALADGESLQFANDTFDLAMEYGVLHHIDLDKAMAEIARVLKPSGKMICTEALGHNPIIHLYRKLTPTIRTEWEVDHILRKKQFKIFDKYFGKIEMRFFHLATLAAVPFRRIPFVFRPLLRTLESVDALLLSLPWVKWQAWQTVFILSDPKKH
ncbi:MAG: hypothetical protein CO113_14190 [Elusimicrobia bacterium CG_4_9_14_3_um_filter_62_55]|nr:MAG: hypothetical protein COR54_19535 [Elusimicrobia bacterium CG22_combo_CG10-13_8_21_14_all_63_91]PJB24394.1 MAG: hypothetical protein CO113_14190 [Elusimicrobia bacterium CG_4_9_14_3_um_filter_62_55]